VEEVEPDDSESLSQDAVEKRNTPKHGDKQVHKGGGWLFEGSEPKSVAGTTIDKGYKRKH